MKLKFADFELEERPPRLTRLGRPVALPLTAIRILAMLVHARGELVSTDDLRRTIWPDRTVDFESSIHTAIRQIRRALGDDFAAPRYVATEPRRGYRFIPEVEELAESVATARSRRTLWPLSALAVAAVAVLGALSWWVSAPRTPPAAIDAGADSRFSATPDPQRAHDRERRRADRARRAAEAPTR